MTLNSALNRVMVAACFFSLVMLGFQGIAVGQTIQAEQPSASPKTASEEKTLPWAQWRGPNRDGRLTNATPWPESLQGESLKEIWNRPLGPSYSGPIVSKDLVFTTETADAKNEVVRALDRKTGEQKWESSWEGAMKVPFFAKANGDWIRSTPAFDGERLYVAGMRDVLVCLDASNGSEVWKVDFVQQFGTNLPNFGFVCSPLVDDKFVYVQAGAGFCKLNKSNGELVWRTLVDKGGMNGSAFSSPFMAKVAGKQQLLVQTRKDLTGVDPESGKVLWSKEIASFRGMNILTPTVYKDSVFTSAYGGTSQLFNVSMESDSATATEAWKNPSTAYMSSPIVIGDHVYLHLRNQRFTCIALRNGQTKWKTETFGKYWSMVANGDKILALDERGDLLLIRVNPEKFELIDQRKITDQPAWAHLTVVGDQLFIRALKEMKALTWK